MYIFIYTVLTALAVYCTVMMIVWDLRTRIIPDAYLFPFMLAGLILCDKLPWTGGFTESVIAAALGYFVGTAMNIVFLYIKARKDVKCKNKRLRSETDTAWNDFDPIGMGDIKLLAAGGIWLGISGLAIALIISSIAGAVWGMWRRQKFVPFAPFFFAGMAVAIITLVFLAF